MIQAPNQPPKGIKNGDEAEARTMLFIITAWFAPSEGDHDTSTDILDVEGDKVMGKVLVAKAGAKCMNPLELGIVNLNSTALEISDIQERTELGLNQSATFIDRFAGAVDLDYCLRRLDGGVPPRNRAVLGNEKEDRLLARRHFEAAGVVKDGSSWS